MPYIDPRSRSFVIEHGARTSGELNFAITRLLIRYTREQSLTTGYGAINDCLGALEGAKLEYYRRVAVPYETHKILENGDVY